MPVLHSSGVIMPPNSTHAPALLGSKCAACGTVVFPQMPVCPSCGRNGQMQNIHIGQKGKLFSHTIARFAPQGFVAPFFQAFIDLDEGPRIFSLIGAECPIEAGVLEDGMEMRIVLEPLADTPENKDLLTYKYVPASKARKIPHA